MNMIHCPYYPEYTQIETTQNISIEYRTINSFPPICHTKPPNAPTSPLCTAVINIYKYVLPNNSRPSIIICH